MSPAVSRTGAPHVVFISSGTDTGVGKTLLTGLLLHQLRQSDCHALAMKPFWSGSRKDVNFLCAVQDGELTRDEINPFFFAESLAPLAPGRKHHRSVHLPEVLRRIGDIASRCQCLLIEGMGGVLVPLGEVLAARDLIAKLGCRIIVVSRNRLGTLNHTLLEAGAL